MVLTNGFRGLRYVAFVVAVIIALGMVGTGTDLSPKFAYLLCASSIFFVLFT